MIIHLKQRNITMKVLEMHQIRWLVDSIILFELFMPIHLLIFQESQGKIESHSSIGSPEHSNHEEEDETPTATSIKTLSCMRLGKHKGKLKQNVTVSH